MNVLLECGGNKNGVLGIEKKVVVDGMSPIPSYNEHHIIGLLDGIVIWNAVKLNSGFQICRGIGIKCHF